MTLPSNEELQRLLDEATPGYWIKGVEMRTGEITIATTDMDADRLTVLDTSNCTEENASLIALAPVLAAEVIRLREENKRLTQIEWLAEQAAESDSGLAYDLDQINRENEGDQA